MSTRRRFGMKPIALAISLILASAGLAAPASAPKVRITQVELGSANRVRVYISIADVNGNPIPDDTARKLEIYESGKRVAAETISEVPSVYSVLMVDLSGSMAGEKLRQAKAAINRYIDLAPASYLAGFEATGGSYLEAKSPGELIRLFETAMGSVARERVIEYTTQQNPDGLKERLEARLVSLDAGEALTATDRVEVVRHGFIPDIKSSLTPYIGGLLILLIAPGIWSIARDFSSVRRFRSAHLRRLRSRSLHLGMLDPNGVQLLAGDAVVMCPACDKPHSVRSWRNNRCACMLEPHGRGSVCFHRALPYWVRHGMDSLSRGRVTAIGRSWLCRCAGDKEGY